MKVTFDTTNQNEVLEVSNFIQNLLLQQANSTESKSKVATEPKPESTKVKPKPTTKKAVEKPVEEKVETPKQEITLTDLKERARERADTTSREKVREVISKFASKLTEVSESDYGKVYHALGQL